MPLLLVDALAKILEQHIRGTPEHAVDVTVRVEQLATAGVSDPQVDFVAVGTTDVALGSGRAGVKVSGPPNLSVTVVGSGNPPASPGRLHFPDAQDSNFRSATTVICSLRPPHRK